MPSNASVAAAAPPRPSISQRRSSWDIAKGALASGSLLAEGAKLTEMTDRSLTKEELRRKRRESLTSGDEVWGKHGAEPKSKPERLPRPSQNNDRLPATSTPAAVHPAVCPDLSDGDTYDV